MVAPRQPAPTSGRTSPAALRPFAGRLAFPGSTAPCLGPVSLALARLAALAGEDAEARHWAAEAVAVCERERMPTWLARALADQGRILAASSDPADRVAADAVYGRAVAVAEAAGCRPVLRQLTGDVCWQSGRRGVAIQR